MVISQIGYNFLNNEMLKCVPEVIAAWTQCATVSEVIGKTHIKQVEFGGSNRPAFA